MQWSQFHAVDPFTTRSLRHRHYFALTMAAQDAEEQGNAPLMITSPMLHECGHPGCSRLTTGGKFLSCCSLCASSTVLTTNGHTPDCDTRNGISTTPPSVRCPCGRSTVHTWIRCCKACSDERRGVHTNQCQERQRQERQQRRSRLMTLWESIMCICCA